MEIDLHALVSHLREAEKGDPKENWHMPEYVFEHIFWPLMCDREVLFAELDFSRLDHEDLTILANRIEESWYKTNSLREIRDVFLKAAPVSATARAFC